MITDIELEKGYNYALQNSGSLMDEAILLHKNGHLARAYTLFHLSIEEIGKCEILYFAILDHYSGISIDKKYLDQHGFTRHSPKIRRAYLSVVKSMLMFNRYQNGGIDVQKVLDNIDESKLNIAKQDSMYVDVKNDVFESPVAVITEDKVAVIAELALFVNASQKGWLRPLAEMKEMGPLWKEITSDPDKEKETMIATMKEYGLSYDEDQEDDQDE